ncbi:hypothetical protein [Parabacteroides distasonis]|uniref:hypothetical protein n=1 Tax=Parabacteroides distasonis TaxID=823 RepID=UPI0012B16E6E|nr:hypothetical protein [Parabacteroides distasonis]MRY39228.1 hypothetical protein [Parabacteroides distasonis]MRZ09410.1 hypothetical protein [Parabacteroides distasonis]
MKNFILLFATAFIIFAAQAQTQRTVQGIVRNDLKIAKSAAKAAETDKTFSMKNIKFWVYDGNGSRSQGFLFEWFFAFG